MDEEDIFLEFLQAINLHLFRAEVIFACSYIVFHALFTVNLTLF